MTITFIQPVAGEVTGPGYVVSASTDFVGAVTDPLWIIRLTDLDDAYEAVHLETTEALPTAHFLFTTLSPAVNGEFVRRRDTLLPHATNAHLHLDFLSGGSVVDSGTITVEFDAVSGALHNITEEIRLLQLIVLALPQTAGLATALAPILATIHPQIGQGVASLLGDLGALITHPPLGVGGLSTPPFDLTGDGSIPVLVPKAIFGLYFVATTIPAGFGRLVGNSVEYQQRLVQFRTVHTVGGVEMVTEIADFNSHGQLWTWAQALPTRVEYSVTPGVEIAAQWWQFP